MKSVELDTKRLLGLKLASARDDVRIGLKEGAVPKSPSASSAAVIGAKVGTIPKTRG